MFDAGSGLADLGAALSGRSGKKKVHLFLSHLHLDHVMGLAVFRPFHDAGAEIHLYGAAAEGKGFGSCLEELVGRPFWPLGLKDFPAGIQVHEIGPESAFSLGESAVAVRNARPAQRVSPSDGADPAERADKDALRTAFRRGIRGAHRGDP